MGVWGEGAGGQIRASEAQESSSEGWKHMHNFRGTGLAFYVPSTLLLVHQKLGTKKIQTKLHPSLSKARDRADTIGNLRPGRVGADMSTGCAVSLSQSLSHPRAPCSALPPDTKDGVECDSISMACPRQANPRTESRSVVAGSGDEKGMGIDRKWRWGFCLG